MSVTSARTPPPFLARAYRALEHGLDRPFGAELNPLKNLGALGFMLLWLLITSGTILYIVLDTSAAGAYRSIEALAQVPWMLGTLLRGLHRYSTDAFIIVMWLHMLREWILGHFQHWRKVTWWTGIPLIILAFVTAIGGFWLNWDKLGQYSAISTAEWLDTLPFFGSPLARNFLGDVSLSDRLFTLFVFIHLGVPLLLVFGLWFHIQRINRAQVFPPRALAWGTLAMLVGLALLLPIRSQGPADLLQTPSPLAIDWFVLFIHPLLESTSATTVWIALGLVFALLCALPLWASAPRQAVAVVYPEHCSGCERCFDDCPYSAITMVAHPNGKPHMRLAQVDPDLCASCGICAGACPSSTPFRSAEHLVTGIDMPQWPIHDVRQQLVQSLKAMPGPVRLVVFGCAQGAQGALIASEAFNAAADTLHFPLVCAGALPPSFIEYALRAGADGVLIQGCRAGGCEFRLGQRWTQQRLQGGREPHLRASVPAQRWRAVWLDDADQNALMIAIEQLRQQCVAHAEAHVGAHGPFIQD